MLDVEGAIDEAVRTSLSYYVAAAVCAVILVAIELHWKRTSVLSVLSLALLVLHPYWWYSPAFTTACRFPIVTDSQVVFGAVAAMLAIRLLRLRSASRGGPG